MFWGHMIFGCGEGAGWGGGFPCRPTFCLLPKTSLKHVESNDISFYKWEQLFW